MDAKEEAKKVALTEPLKRIIEYILASLSPLLLVLIPRIRDLIQSVIPSLPLQVTIGVLLSGLILSLTYIFLNRNKGKKLKIDAPKRKILTLLAEYDSINILQIESQLEMKRNELKYHLNELEAFKYIGSSSSPKVLHNKRPNPDEETKYYIQQNGREFIFKNS